MFTYVKRNAAVGVLMLALLVATEQAAAQNPNADQHARYGPLQAAMQGQFTGLFVADNSAPDGGPVQMGAVEVPNCARIHPLDASEENRNGGVLSYCAEDAHLFNDWLCLFDTAFSLENTWPALVTRAEIEAAQDATEIRMWIGGPFGTPPSDVADFVLNADAYPEHLPTVELPVWSGSIRKFNAGVVLHDYPDPLFQIQFQHAWTYPNGTIFDQQELEPSSFYTLKLQICSSIALRPGSPTRNSSLGGWADVRAQTEEGCWWERAMVIEIKAHEDDPDRCCAAAE